MKYYTKPLNIYIEFQSLYWIKWKYLKYPLKDIMDTRVKNDDDDVVDDDADAIRKWVGFYWKYT